MIATKRAPKIFRDSGPDMHDTKKMNKVVHNARLPKRRELRNKHWNKPRATMSHT
jgi:hypothetical protein